MKILKIFGWVVGIHLAAFLAIFSAPGCQSGPRNIPTPDATLPAPGSTVAPVTYSPSLASPTPVDLGTSGSSVVTYSPASPSGQARPTRPGSPAAAAVVPARPTADVTPVTTYTVGRGDSLWSIAKKNGMTVSELAKANSVSTGVALKPGQKLLIPGKAPVAGAAPKDLAVVPPATGKSVAEKPAAVAHAGSDAVTYTVLPGESLGTIAKKFQMKTGELAAANSITDPSRCAPARR
ncbi:MAG: Muramidase-2 precursor [Lacunisphaera sp.]|nr:Muramidase-2 precursor [Lacunisphaera sp.]